MDDTRSVCRRESLCHLSNNRQGFAGGHSAFALKSLMECFAVQQLHRQEGDVLRSHGVVKQIENPANVRVRYFSSKVNFTLETFHCLGGAGNLGTYGLQCHALPQLEILGFINVAHAAPGDEPHNSEAAGQKTPLGKTRRGGNAGCAANHGRADTRHHLGGKNPQIGEHVSRILITIQSFLIDEPANELGERCRQIVAKCLDWRDGNAWKRQSAGRHFV